MQTITELEYQNAIRPEMIELRRRMLGLSQTELAARVGIVQGTLSKIEQGLKPVTIEQTLLFAEALSCHPSFFSLPERLYGGPISANPMYRKKASVGLKVLDRLLAEMNVRIGHIRKLMQFVDYRPELPLPFYDLDDYEGDPTKIAENVRRAWYMPNGPVRNLVEWLERAGIIIVECDMDDAGLSGVSYHIHGLPPLIFINKNQPMDRYRFTLAHELGHLVMHKIPNPNMEEEANMFAAELLMPSREIAPYLQDLTIEKAAYMKPFWRVSMAALIYRAKVLNQISSGQYEYIWRQMSARRYRINEPVQLEQLGESPSLMPELFKQMKEDMEYSPDEITQVLGLHYSELNQLYGFEQERKLRLVR
ncbi:XRE family transcriptional regulator [Aeromonas hydrophila]|jgi:Zn-dependent peptidase ImmA (M78 family)/DNA-binding XRE family transcriptional regulator|uniref:helix-turn-helix domain-containing protein n=1 Tax=Aeromonas hydrophila TaxID=644 RepID=UPI00301B3331